MIADAGMIVKFSVVTLALLENFIAIPAGL